MERITQIAAGIEVAAEDSISWDIEAHEGFILLGPDNGEHTPNWACDTLLKNDWVYSSENEGWIYST